MADYIIRPVKRDDAKSIWRIRNQPLMRQRSGNQAEISFKQHNLWFEKKYFSGEDNLGFVLEDKNRVVGYCRFDSDDKGRYIISIALNYGYQGRGLGSLLLSESLSKLKTGKEVLATVKKENESSLKLFQKNNFKLDKEDEKIFYLKYGKNYIPKRKRKIILPILGRA